MKIAVIGTGYVGLVAGACFAENGNDVICVDKDEAKVRMLRRGRMPIYEPGLEEIVVRNSAEKRLTFTSLLNKAVRQSSIIFIAVGTPQGEDGSADLQHEFSLWTTTGQADTREFNTPNECSSSVDRTVGEFGCPDPTRVTTNRVGTVGFRVLVSRSSASIAWSSPLRPSRRSWPLPWVAAMAAASVAFTVASRA